MMNVFSRAYREMTLALLVLTFTAYATMMPKHAQCVNDPPEFYSSVEALVGCGIVLAMVAMAMWILMARVADAMERL